MDIGIRAPLRVRQRRAIDDSFIAELAARAFAEYDPHSVRVTLRMARAGTTWLALRDGEPVGFAVLRSVSDREQELGAIAVDERARGSGVGGALLAHIERTLSAAGGGQIRLHTAQANLAAMDLFLKRGFRVEQRLPRFYRGVFDACALCKRVPLARGR